MKKTTYEREYEKETNKIRSEILKDEFAKGFIEDYGTYVLEHPVKATVIGAGIGVACGVIIKVATGALPLPARIAASYAGTLIMPTVFGMKRVDNVKRELTTICGRA